MEENKSVYMVTGDGIWATIMNQYINSDRPLF